ncbi:MAG TPA: cupin domain-containing protein [Galbitalea sp.]|nr:cupin domain-containing protein [Galbitalea sp.]
MDLTTLGERIRAARKARALTQEQLGSRIGVSPSLLSKIETGLGLPSTWTLRAIAAELELDIDSSGQIAEVPAENSASSNPFTSEYLDEREIVFRRGSRPSFDLEGGTRVEKIPSPLLDSTAESLLITFSPYRSDLAEPDLLRHEGIEIGYIIVGELTLRFAEQEMRLEAGDSVSFDSSVPHCYVNLGSVPATGLWTHVTRIT